MTNWQKMEVPQVNVYIVLLKHEVQEHYCLWWRVSAGPAESAHSLTSIHVYCTRGNVTHKPSIFARVWELSQMELHPGPIEVKARIREHWFTRARITSVTRTRTSVLCPDLWPSETVPRTKENTIAFVPAQGLSPCSLPEIAGLQVKIHWYCKNVPPQ